MDKGAMIETMRPDVLGCHQCALRSQAHQVVFGEGNAMARLVFIGEGPGMEEDRQGRPFVGAAGQLLDKMLAAIGMTRFEHVYILNVVKCRPPQNRTPLPEEVASCLPHLKRQLDILDPLIIVLLGATPTRTLLDPQVRITQARGRWVYRDNRWWMPTFHPAALLRRPEWKRSVWSDLKLVLDKYRQLIDPDHDSPYYPVHR
ncbi:MAG: uracil-DNA glycosylase [Sulfobacillus acidophilus]|uniref:Type-4 uracil-DNA glycosylase n=1 Tax=Sulfobacillus acidophilus TaxID=53633 RepID=A0A2T2WER6_9FIRM|nr:MAG: uracil-DNA glycosylase [Sulfobacillus acidophilus]